MMGLYGRLQFGSVKTEDKVASNIGHWHAAKNTAIFAHQFGVSGFIGFDILGDVWDTESVEPLRLGVAKGTPTGFIDGDLRCLAVTHNDIFPFVLLLYIVRYLGGGKQYMVDGIKPTIFQFFVLMLYLAHNNRGKNVTDIERMTKSIPGGRRTRGFALPTILISSIVMLIVLLAAVTSTTAVRTAMKTQYYTQLAQVAGDAGVAYAKACLSANGGLPQWSNANPLMPNTDCSGAQLAGFSCPSVDARCSVTLNGDVRSSFSIGMPPVDATGKALTLPNTGFVEILRTSNGAVWRRYQQNTVPSVAVPDLCSGSATSVLGWNNAAITTTTFPIPEPTAKPIAIATGNLNPGPNYFRKDFSVTQAGVYTLTGNSDGHSNFYIDSALVLSMYNTTATSVTVNLAVGCHTIMVRDTNGAILPGGFNIMASLKLNGASSPIVVSDTTDRKSVV